jgi:predicted dehydrogenase
MRQIKVALVGAGYMATEHAKAFDGLPGVKLVGIYSRTRDRADLLAEKYSGMIVCDSVTDLYEKTQADLVIVTVKELSMGAVAKECFDFSWAVLLEKPAGYNLKDATSILETANKSQSKVYVALNRRAYSSTRQALSRLEKDPEFRFVKVMDQQDQIAAKEIYNEPPEVVYNYMFANSVHLIDYFRVFCRGEVLSVLPLIPWSPDNPGVVLSKIEFSSGDIGLYEGIWNGPGPWAVSISTAQERLELKPLEQVTLQIRGERKVMNLDIDIDDSLFKPGLRYQASQAIAAVRGEINSMPTLSDSWQSMKLVAKIFNLDG